MLTLLGATKKHQSPASQSEYSLRRVGGGERTFLRLDDMFALYLASLYLLYLGVLKRSTVLRVTSEMGRVSGYFAP